MPSTGPFASEEDETSCLKWVLGHCKDYKRKIAEDGQFTLDAFDDLSDIDDPGEALSKIKQIVSYCEDRLLELSSESEEEAFDLESWDSTWYSFSGLSAVLGNPVTIHDHKIDSNGVPFIRVSEFLFRTMIFGWRN